VKKIVVCKALPVTGLGGLWGCEILRIPHCPDSRLTDGGKVVSPMHRPYFTPQKHYYFYVSDTHFCQELSIHRGLVWLEGLGEFKKITSSGSSWLQIQRPGFDSRRCQIFWEVVGLERGPLSLVSTIEELLERKSSGSGLEIRKYGRRDPSH
jgi:hypothetical protein